MSTYRKEWPCCGDISETQGYEPERCPFCAPAIAAPTATSEPVAIYQVWDFGPAMWSDVSKDEYDRYNNADRRIVYAAPAPQQTPLTDARIAELYEQATTYELADEDYAGVRLFVRLIERELSASAVTATTEQDAARYRWLRNSAKSVDWCRAWLSNGGVAFSYYCRTSPEAMDQEIDRAIDRAAMASTGKEKKQ